ncbi:ROK family transcriptional regulator [Bryocella elongata]|nr:ROK family transcriptional regulator [Bryocella elongata]
MSCEPTPSQTMRVPNPVTPALELTGSSEPQPSRPSHLRQVNARALLRLIREHNPCSKAELVRLSGLSAPTVSSAVSHLATLGLIEHLGEGESSGGRPPEMLRFHAGHGHVAGVDIGGTRLRMVLADLNGRIVTQWAHQFTEKERTPRAVCDLILEGLRCCCQEIGGSMRKVLHLTAGAPGITNVETGVVVSAPNLTDWNGVPLRAMLEERLDLPVSVENDTNLAAVGEHWRGSAKGVANFVFIAMGTGVGAGIFLLDRLHHGANWSAGEIGYMSVEGQPREPLRIRAVGQLERIIGGLAIEKEWHRLLAKRGRTTDAALRRLRASEVFDLAAEGDRLAREVVQYTARILAHSISELSLVLDPEMVILGGGVGSHAELCRATDKLLSENEFGRPALRQSSLGPQAQLHGAISVSLSASEMKLLS